MQVERVLVSLCRVQRGQAIRNGLYTYSEGAPSWCAWSPPTGWWASAGPTPRPRMTASSTRRPAPWLATPWASSVFDVEALWERMYQPKLVGRRGLTTRAMSAVDIAMWDAAGKTIGVPLYRLLGGARQRVPAYLAGGYYVEGKTLDDLAAEMRQKVGLGARYVKIKIGGAPWPRTSSGSAPSARPSARTSRSWWTPTMPTPRSTRCAWPACWSRCTPTGSKSRCTPRTMAGWPTCARPPPSPSPPVRTSTPVTASAT